MSFETFTDYHITEIFSYSLNAIFVAFLVLKARICLLGQSGFCQQRFICNQANAYWRNQRTKTNVLG